MNTFKPQTAEQAGAIKAYIRNNFNHPLDVLEFINGLERGKKVKRRREGVRAEAKTVIEVQIKGFIIDNGEKLEYVSYTKAKDWKYA